MQLSVEDERAVRRRLLFTLLIATVAEVVVIQLVLRNVRPEVSRWQSVVATLAIVTGISVLYNFWRFPFSTRDRLVKMAVMANPGAVGVFGGVAILAAGAELDVVLVIAGLLAVGGVIAGFALLCWHLLFVYGKRGAG